MKRNDPLLYAYAAAVADMEERDSAAAGAVRAYVTALRDESARRRIRARDLEARLRDLEGRFG